MKLTNLSNRKKGIIFITASAFGFAMMSAFVKISGDLPSFQKTFFRYSITNGGICTNIKTQRKLFWTKK